MGTTYEHPTYKNRVAKLQIILDAGGWIDPNSGFLYDDKDTHITNVSQQFINGLKVAYCPINLVYLSTALPEEIVAKRQMTNILKGDNQDELFKPAPSTTPDRNKVQQAQRTISGRKRPSW